MAEEGYLSSAWESGDQFELPSGHGRPQLRTFDSAETSSQGAHAMSSSSHPRSSVDSPGRSSTSKWPESPPQDLPTERREGPSIVHGDTASLVEPSFDESVLRALCELDVRPDSLYIT
jgi:Rho GTPase-activating protein RGD1